MLLASEKRKDSSSDSSSNGRREDEKGEKSRDLCERRTSNEDIPSTGSPSERACSKPDSQTSKDLEVEQLKNSDSSLSSSSSSLSTTQDSALGIGVISKSNCLEVNTYSYLPVWDTEEKREEAKTEVGRAAKPVPLPRRTCTKKFSELKSLSVPAPHTNEGKQNCTEFNRSVSFIEGDCAHANGDIHITDSDKENAFSSESVDSETLRMCMSLATEHSDKSDEKSKDENENFYTLMYDSSDYLTAMASPPPIPPLPPRHDSLADWGSTNSATSKFSKNPTDDQENSLKQIETSRSEISDTPPLPLPRRTSTNLHSCKSKTLTNGLDTKIPPIPPLRSPLKTCKVDKPPALPSRSTQSFFIKRPQPAEEGNGKGINMHKRALPEPPTADADYEANSGNCNAFFILPTVTISLIT